jgi:hypothetical protein
MPSASYKHLKKFDPATMNEGKRLPFQLQTILDHIEKAGKEGITQEKLVEQLSQDNKLNTRQPVERVINFYHQRMKDLALVEVNKVSAPKTPAQKPGGNSGRTTVVIGEDAAEQSQPKPQSQGAPSVAHQVGKPPV